MNSAKYDYSDNRTGISYVIICKAIFICIAGFIRSFISQLNAIRLHLLFFVLALLFIPQIPAAPAGSSNSLSPEENILSSIYNSPIDTRTAPSCMTESSAFFASCTSNNTISISCPGGQTCWTTVKAGNWSDPTVWDLGTVPAVIATTGLSDGIIPTNDVINVKHNVNYDLSASIDNYGELNIFGDTLNVPGGRSLTININGLFTITNGAYITPLFNGGSPNSGAILNQGGREIHIGAYIEIPQDWKGTANAVRTFINGCLFTGENYSNDLSTDTLINVCIEIGAHNSGNFEMNTDQSNAYFEDVNIKIVGLSSGNTVFQKGTVSGNIESIYLAGGGQITTTVDIVGTVDLDYYWVSDPALFLDFGNIFSGNPQRDQTQANGSFPCACQELINDCSNEICFNGIDDDCDGLVDCDDPDCGSTESPCQSTNCNCTNNLITNGTFEGSSTSGWTVESGIQTLFNSSLDGCGSMALWLQKIGNPGIVDPTIWQQVNNVDPGSNCTLAFDAGVRQPTGLHRIYLRFYNSTGNFLSEDFLEINHDTDSNGALRSYSFSMNAPTNSSYLRVVAVLDSDWLYLDNVCLSLLDCFAPTFNLQSPELRSGTWGQVNSTYNYYNAYPGTNVILTIVSKTHSDMVIESLDEPEATNGGYDWAFQPIIDYNWYNGGGSNDPAGEKSFTFRFDFVDAVTGEAVSIPQLNMTAVDVDGNAVGIREFVYASGFQAYELQTPSELTLSGSLKAKGDYATWSGVVETALSTMISYVYNSPTSVTATYGADFDGGNDLDDVMESRMNCLYFKCYDFNIEVICPSITVSGGNSFCSGATITLQSSNTGGAGLCKIQWQSSTNNATWTNISGATSLSYSPTLTTSMYYRATFSCSGNATCGTIYSNSEYVDVLVFSQII